MSSTRSSPAFSLTFCLQGEASQQPYSRSYIPVAQELAYVWSVLGRWGVHISGCEHPHGPRPGLTGCAGPVMLAWAASCSGLVNAFGTPSMHGTPGPRTGPCMRLATAPWEACHPRRLLSHYGGGDATRRRGKRGSPAAATHRPPANPLWERSSETRKVLVGLGLFLRSFLMRGLLESTHNKCMGSSPRPAFNKLCANIVSQVSLHAASMDHPPSALASRWQHGSWVRARASTSSTSGSTSSSSGLMPGVLQGVHPAVRGSARRSLGFLPPAAAWSVGRGEGAGHTNTFFTPGPCREPHLAGGIGAPHSVPIVVAPGGNACLAPRPAPVVYPRLPAPPMHALQAGVPLWGRMGSVGSHCAGAHTGCAPAHAPPVPPVGQLMVQAGVASVLGSGSTFLLVRGGADESTEGVTAPLILRELEITSMLDLADAFADEEEVRSATRIAGQTEADHAVRAWRQCRQRAPALARILASTPPRSSSSPSSTSVPPASTPHTGVAGNAPPSTTTCHPICSSRL